MKRINEFDISEYFSQDDVDADGTIRTEKIQENNLCDWTFMKITCFKCNEMFNDYVAFTHHFKEMHPNEKIKYICSMCSKDELFLSTRKYVDHGIKKHFPHLFYW